MAGRKILRLCNALVAMLAVVALMAAYWHREGRTCLRCEIPQVPVAQYQPFFVEVPMPGVSCYSVQCLPCSPTLICSACFADTDPCEVCKNLKDDPRFQEAAP